MQIKILLPIKVSTNKIYAGIHWTTRKKHKEMFFLATKNAIIQQGINPIKGDFPVNFLYSFYFDRNSLDSSNCSYMAKMIEDALVSCEIIPDDTNKYVRDFTLNSQRKKGEDSCIVNF